MLRDNLLLRTRLTPPRPYRRVLARPGLLARLREAFDYRLTVVQAGTGYGKTTALAALLANAQGPGFWYSLDESDRDAQQFLSYLVGACHMGLPSLPDAPLAVLSELRNSSGSQWSLVVDALANALAEQLTEMFTTGMIDLYEAGVITNRRKTLWPGKMVGAFALGEKKLYDFLDHNLAVEFQQGNVTNDPYVIGKNYKMVSVNTALQVDVLGQVCSQSIGPRHFSGTGGQLDTHRGAQRSEGGRGIIALRSTAKGGSISTIVPTLATGAEVTVPSQDTDTIVTEYGIAELRGRSVKDRLRALTAIAHPSFRTWLIDEAERLGIVPRLVAPGFTPPG